MQQVVCAQKVGGVAATATSLISTARALNGTSYAIGRILAFNDKPFAKALDVKQQIKTLSI